MRMYTGGACGSFAVCIDSYHNGVPVGRFYTQQSDEPCYFENVTRCLVQMEQIMDSRHKRGDGEGHHTFDPSQSRPSARPVQMDYSGKAGTFMVRVLFRQNESWQGSVIWLEGRQEQSFRSVLELILLMDSALQGHKE